ncbi:hypothetical protein [Thermomonospora umbrina]|nr:hypothetical protein [Thermomonospora umbrina]
MAEFTNGDGCGFGRLASRLDLARWQLRLAGERGLVPPPDLTGGRWSAALVEETARRATDIRSALGEEPPIGAIKAAERLSVRIGLDVERADVEALVVAGALPLIDHYQGRALYDPHDLDGLDADHVTETVRARKGALFDTVHAKGAATLLGCSSDQFTRIAAHHGLTPDQLGRYPLAEVKRLAADRDLRAAIVELRRTAALDSAHRDATRAERTIDHWLQRCSDYLTDPTANPPDTRPLTRALRTLATSRAALERDDAFEEERSAS